MKVAYHFPAPDTIYAQRTIHRGFGNAFVARGHDFVTYGPGVDLAAFLDREQPDLFMTCTHPFYRRQLDLELLADARRSGMVMLTKLDFWNPTPQRLRMNESLPMSEDRRLRDLLDAGLMGDAFYHVVEHGDRRMDGFEEATGHHFHTVPLAADPELLDAHPQDRFRTPLAYLGTHLRAKRDVFESHLFPLRSRGLRIYGQDWTPTQRFLGKAQRVGQYFNVPGLRALQRPALDVRDEGAIYASAAISLNLHEGHQREFGGDTNERSFKIPLAGGFQLVDDVAALRRYFVDGEEIVMARDADDWIQKVDHFLAAPDERARIAAAGRARVARDHLYVNRVDQIAEIVATRGWS